MKALSWIIGFVSGLCLVAAVSLLAERTYYRNEVDASLDSLHAAMKQVRSAEAELDKCQKAANP